MSKTMVMAPFNSRPCTDGQGVATRRGEIVDVDDPAAKLGDAAGAIQPGSAATLSLSRGRPKSRARKDGLKALEMGRLSAAQGYRGRRAPASL